MYNVGITDQKPHFMDNKDWFIFDPVDWRYKLTDEGAAIPEVKRSYDDFYALED